MTVYIDGYNLMGWLGYFDSMRKGEITWREAKNKILRKISESPSLKNADQIKIVLVYDSKGGRDFSGKLHHKKIKRFSHRGIKIIFPKSSADDFIWRVAEKGEAVVTTRDRELREQLEKKGVQVRSLEFFFKKN